MDIKILYEDQDILVVDKPAGIIVNRADTVKNVTVQDWAEKHIFSVNYFNEEDKKSDFYIRGGIVHRLDKETSGVMVLAKNEYSFKELQRQFRERIVEKKYIALVHGKLVPPVGEISVPVGRLPWNRTHFGVVPGGRESVTYYKVLNYLKNQNFSIEYLSFVELTPKTGRTHQIRVHLKYLGHPIFSDFLYAGRKTARRDRKMLPRVFLHAQKLKIRQPSNGLELDFYSDLPNELSGLVEKFEKVK